MTVESNDGLMTDQAQKAIEALDRLSTVKFDAMRFNDCIDTLRTYITSTAGQGEDAIDVVYFERNQVVAALAKRFPSGIKKTAIDGWDEEWHGCVFIDLPTGQASWHYHDSHAYLFAGLPEYKGTWDGHDTPEKYRRVNALQPHPPQPDKCEGLIEALEWYADKEKYIPQVVFSTDENGNGHSRMEEAVIFDKGWKASKAIAKYKETT